MYQVIIILRPHGRWCLEVNGVRSPENLYQHPIIFNGFMGLTEYYEGQSGVYSIHKTNHNEVIDETV